MGITGIFLIMGKAGLIASTISHKLRSAHKRSGSRVYTAVTFTQRVQRYYHYGMRPLKTILIMVLGSLIP